MKTLFRLSVLCIVLSSCRDEFVFSTPPKPAFQYLITSELSRFDIVALEINESIAIGQALENFDRRDAEIVFSGRDVPGGQIAMAFNNTSKKYHLINEDFRVSEGSEYEVSIILPDEAADTIIAKTMIPRSVGFTAEILGHNRIPIDDELSHHTIELVIRPDAPLQRPSYYRFIPSRLESVMRKGSNGIEDFTDLPTKQLLEVAQVKSNNNAVEFFAERPGIHIEESRLNEDGIHLILKTIEPLRDGEAVSVKDEGREVIRRLSLELQTLNQELYEYYSYVNQLVINQGANIPTQSRTVTNIQNASGVFGGLSRTSITPDID